MPERRALRLGRDIHGPDRVDRRNLMMDCVSLRWLGLIGLLWSGMYDAGIARSRQPPLPCAVARSCAPHSTWPDMRPQPSSRASDPSLGAVLQCPTLPNTAQPAIVQSEPEPWRIQHSEVPLVKPCALEQS